MASTTAPVSLLKRDQQPVSSGPTHTQTHTYGSTNTYEPTQAQRDTEILSGLYSQLGRRGRERDGGQREGRKMRRMSETDRWRGIQGGRGEETERGRAAKNWEEGKEWKCMVTLVGGRCEDSAAHQHQSEPNFSCPVSSWAVITMATHTHIFTLTAVDWHKAIARLQCELGLHPH